MKSKSKDRFFSTVILSEAKNLHLLISKDTLQMLRCAQHDTDFLQQRPRTSNPEVRATPAGEEKRR